LFVLGLFCSVLVAFVKTFSSQVSMRSKSSNNPTS